MKEHDITDTNLEVLQARLRCLLWDTHSETHGRGSVVARRELETLYATLLSEEMEELRREAPGTPEHMKELCDVLWVLIQYANLCKYDLAKGLEALIDEYESKFYTAEGEYEPIYREDGKLLKNTGFKKADFSKFFRG